MAAFIVLLVVNEIRICPFRPTAGSRVEHVRKDAARNRNGRGDALDIEERLTPVLPIETTARNPRVRQPGDRDVVEDVVARQALRLSLKYARDQLIAARVVVEEVRREADG